MVTTEKQMKGGVSYLATQACEIIPSLFTALLSSSLLHFPLSSASVLVPTPFHMHPVVLLAHTNCPELLCSTFLPLHPLFLVSFPQVTSRGMEQLEELWALLGVCICCWRRLTGCLLLRCVEGVFLCLWWMWGRSGSNHEN